MATVKDNFAAIGTVTCTVANLASSGSVGRQSDLIDNTTNLYTSSLVGLQITPGAVTTAGAVSVYLIRSDNGGGPIADDNAGTGDAAWTWKNASLLGVMAVGVGTNIQYKNVFDTSFLGHLGPKWGVGIVNTTGANTNSTAGSHSLTYIGVTQTVA